ncbi:bifunctional 3'-5' exonuclease/DNA polymerase [Georgenia yuyongxinii]|uniref:DNA-directed DNA polymerase n=1 Tax=Georgenia yuyongxinii TaxID=2589797 RepID=A0A5B8C9Q7_9MICO|nr:bifunctional 3'-5' exonuclease/DNA polymerase [Georgenia yuyongxinii]QDC26185.1 bifunctional 3'-5' exonuclease/DNA polymerase [Georgenia yuyongxinii]
MDVVVAASAEGVHLVRDGDDPASAVVPAAQLPDRVRALERDRPRWVWADTATTYPALLRAGVRVERCHDLRLCHTILRHAAATAGSSLATAPPGPWDALAADDADRTPTLLDDLAPAIGPDEVLGEHARQRAALALAADPGRLRLLLAAESAGALIAAEMSHDGLPWDRAIHDRLLTELLGPRPAQGGRPPRLEALARQVRELLDAPHLNPDSPPELLRALRGAGLDVTSTSKWELAELDHPVITPLLEYKRLARLLSANGWAWMDAWIRPPGPGHRGRFHPDYVPGGVVSGRWATRGGGALQLPKQVRGAVVPDPGWKLVVADAAQLEPRVLAAMARDEQMARAGRGADLYQGLVDAGVVERRAHAKVAMLGAMYGATTGDAGQLMPRLKGAYPRAIGVVDRAAQTGERGGVVSTWLGRTSPPPPEEWHVVQRRASEADADESARRGARRRARDWGRFTRNFVVQGSAAEWALCWMADLRLRLRRIGDGAAHLVFFLHDEVIVHTPARLADDVAAAVHEAAAGAGRLLFGDFPVDFPLDVAVVDSYAEA